MGMHCRTLAPVKTLSELLDRIEEAAGGGERVSFGAILKEVGERSFGPLLLLAGVVALAPVIGDVPGVPTLVGLMVVLVAAQLLLRREHFWLPRWLLERSVAKEKLCKALGWLRRPARFVDRLLRPRLQPLAGHAALHAMALASLLIGVAMPAMELIPFSANGAGAALTAFGLALIARDGLVALLGFVFTAVTAGAALYGLL